MTFVGFPRCASQAERRCGRQNGGGMEYRGNLGGPNNLKESERESTFTVEGDKDPTYVGHQP